ncbi:MAG TPA: 3-hydroxyacyl-CoA dehydrogenase/enoyl-CoA hydratase family protein [Geopsychrobacteraceae bacterium]|nr:3-hydroxyacyl-CoA dehydrogenase/enoyl-CoA hydratase family protein [Geopsychrobacteraceae bacterium]
MRQINRVAVLGAGVMGATIAAHLANAGLEVKLLDMVPPELSNQEKSRGLTLKNPEVRNRFAAQGLQGLFKMKPAPLYLTDYATQIEIGNFTDDLPRLNECDWVIEVVIEQLLIKKELFAKLVPHLAPGAILSTNTSGLSINELAETLPLELQRNCLVTHFFNPPRYMRLLEIVPCKNTDPATVTGLADFISRRLGKGIVYAKDTPNFIANRIGVYAIYKGIEHMLAMDLTVEEVDSVSGPATARPKSAVFRTSDLVGLDTLAHVGNNSYQLLTEDEERDIFKLPDFLQQMIEKGLLGDKSKQGFYRKETVDGKRQIYFYDYKSGEYQPARKPKFPSVQSTRQIDDPAQRIATVLSGNDKGAEFAWRSLRDTLIYAVNRVPEIADDILNIDNAMRWGFNWELGPFEMLDAIGVNNFIKRTEADSIDVPESLRGVESFYHFNEAGGKEYFDLQSREYRLVPIKPGQLCLEIIKRAGGVVEKNSDCSLIDLGDGVFGLEFHSKMNAIGSGTLAMTSKAIARAEQEGVGLVIGNQGTNFSVGANLMMMAVAMAEGAYEDIDMMVRAFQKTTMAVKYSKIPIVAAPFGMTLGGGCEFSLHADAINAYAETYMGMVEIGVGLLPAGGGTKEMCLRAVQLAQQYETDVTPFIFKYFKQIGMATVSMGAAELRNLGYLCDGDSISMDIDRLISDAKQKVLALASNYRPRQPVNNLPAPGRSIAASIGTQLWNMQQGGYITDYEAEIGRIIAGVICGGDVPAGMPITEHYLLQLEREAFLKLCGNKKTAERIQNMLKTGKPLRN